MAVCRNLILMEVKSIVFKQRIYNFNQITCPFISLFLKYIIWKIHHYITLSVISPLNIVFFFLRILLFFSFEYCLFIHLITPSLSGLWIVASSSFEYWLLKDWFSHLLFSWCIVLCWQNFEQSGAFRFGWQRLIIILLPFFLVFRLFPNLFKAISFDAKLLCFCLFLPNLLLEHLHFCLKLYLSFGLVPFQRLQSSWGRSLSFNWFGPLSLHLSGLFVTFWRGLSLFRRVFQDFIFRWEFEPGNEIFRSFIHFAVIRSNDLILVVLNALLFGIDIFGLFNVNFVGFFGIVLDLISGDASCLFENGGFEVDFSFLNFA